MTATVEQIVEEAERRAERHRLQFGGELQHTRFLIEVVRENWTPPEPVDPDILAFREWGVRNSEEKRYWGHAIHYREGYFDRSFDANAYVAGARMAREQERERVKVLLEYVQADARRLDHVGVRARAAVAEYEEGGR